MKLTLFILLILTKSVYANLAPNSILAQLPYDIVPGTTKLTKINKFGKCIDKGVVFGYYITCIKFQLDDHNIVNLDDEETVSRLHLKDIPDNWKKLGFSKKMTFLLFKDLLKKNSILKYDVTSNDTFYVVKFTLNSLNYEFIFNKQSYYSTGAIMFPEGLHEIYIETIQKLDLDF